jgi:hypothetical protein
MSRVTKEQAASALANFTERILKIRVELGESQAIMSSANRNLSVVQRFITDSADDEEEKGDGNGTQDDARGVREVGGETADGEGLPGPAR